MGYGFPGGVYRLPASAHTSCEATPSIRATTRITAHDTPLTLRPHARILAYVQPHHHATQITRAEDDIRYLARKLAIEEAKPRYSPARIERLRAALDQAQRSLQRLKEAAAYRD